MRKLDHLIAEAIAKLPPDITPKVVVFGSAPLALDGVKIREDIKDLDLFVSDETFDELVLRGFRSRVKLKDTRTGEDVLHIVIAGNDGDPDVEVLKTFQGVRFADVYRNSIVHASGLRIGALEDLRAWKIASGRPKDLVDVEAINRFLAQTEPVKPS